MTEKVQTSGMAKDGTNRGRPPKHGRYSGNVLPEVMKEKLTYLLELAGKNYDVITTKDQMAVELLARTLAKIELFDRFFAKHGLMQLVDGKVDVQPALKQYVALANTAQRLLGVLGLTPEARFKMRLELAKTEDVAGRIGAAKQDEMKSDGGGNTIIVQAEPEAEETEDEPTEQED